MLRLEVDHVVPCIEGGKAVEWNLQVLCQLCNRAKGPYFHGRHATIKTRLMARYWVIHRTYFEAEERAAFTADVDRWRTRGRWATTA